MAEDPRFTLCAEPDDIQVVGDLGFGRDEIALCEPDGRIIGIDTPQLNAGDDRSIVDDTINGADSVIPRPRRLRVDLKFEYITWELVREIQRLMHDERDVYFTPGWARFTHRCYPLQRSIKAWSVGPDLSCARAIGQYVWDEHDQIIRTYANNQPALGMHGRHARYLATGGAFTNRASKPHPDSGAVGWALDAGSGSAVYTEAVLSPIIDQHSVVNGKGCTLLQATTPSLAGARFGHPASGLNTVDDIAACTYLHGRGDVEVRLLNSAAAVIATSGVVTLRGGWRQFRLWGANTSAGTTAKVDVWMLSNTTALGTQQGVLAGPVVIGQPGTTDGTPWVPDWVGISPAVADVIDNNTLATPCGALSIAFAARYRPSALGFVEMGGGGGATLALYKQAITAGQPDSFVVAASGSSSFSFTDIKAQGGGIADGDWFHVVVVFDGHRARLYINGTEHSQGPQSLAIPASYDNTLFRVGNVYGTHFLSGSGMAWLRVEGEAWTPERAQQEWRTYFDYHGVAVMEPFVGRKFRIEDFVTRAIAEDDAQRQSGTIRLRQVHVSPNHASLSTQEYR